nr:PBECR4 domain-containing protein [Sporosarcina limicola]
MNLLREYYETYLNPYIYQFEIVDESGEKPVKRTIELRFDQENFCHLFGLESIVRRHVRNTGPYKGQAGWDTIKNGIIDFSDLKVKNKGGFTDNKARFVFFYLVPRLFESPKGLLFDPDKVSVNTYVDCELLFYDQFQKTYVHIGIMEDINLGYYIPKTFLIEKMTKQSDGQKYIKRQQTIHVTKISKEEIEII